MGRRIFLLGCAALLLFASCARDGERAPVYDAKQCPFCTPQPGACGYCKGSSKCSFCKGTGKRTTVWTAVPGENIGSGSYTEQCAFCKGSGTCGYCGGIGKCRVCKGTGNINDWNFYENFNNEKK